MRGSSDNGDITEKTHILVADFETTPDSEVLGSGIDFFGGTSPDYFVLESDIHVFDRFAATAVLLHPTPSRSRPPTRWKPARPKCRRARCTAIPGAPFNRSAAEVC